MDTRCVNKDDLRGGVMAFFSGDFKDARDAIARGLSLGRDNGYLLADERVEERAFAGVGAAENGYETRFQNFLTSLLFYYR